MTEDRTKDRTIKVDYLARVEGEGALTIRYDGEEVEHVELSIFEPPRFFEAFLRGRDRDEAPDITARICGICPVAYQMSAVHALERAQGARVEGVLRDLRRLLYCGEWIESHVLHMFMLHAPDFLGVPDAMTMAVDHGDMVKAGLAMKKIGNRIVSVLGGREIHPINVRVGGFYRAPRRSELTALVPDLEAALETAIERALPWMAGLHFPDFDRDVEFVGLRHPDEYPFNEGRVVSSRGLDIDVDEYDEHFAEVHLEHSTALHSRRRGVDGPGTYLCGPLARFNLDFEQLSPRAREAAGRIGLAPPVTNPFRSILVRMIETIHAYEEALRIIGSYAPPERPAIAVGRARATGRAATEAPRGLLYHRYTTDDAGLIEQATIVPPTSQNQGSIEDDLRAIAPSLLALDHERATRRAEQTIRNYDPCISCATHFLKLRIER